MAYTTIDDPSAYFQTTTYEGTGSTRNVTNGGNSDLQPDFVWLKSTDTTSNHNVFDSNRGVTKRLIPNDTNAEDTLSAFSHFLSDGFTITGSPLNDSGSDWISFQWKCNGGTLTTVNSNGTSNKVDEHQRQTNTTSGFAIVTYEGVEDDNGNFPVFTHSLGKTAEFVLVKNRSQADHWSVLHKTTSAANGLNSLILNDTAAVSTSPDPWDGNAGNANDVYVKGQPSAVHNVNADGENYVAYCFTSIQGFSKFGSFTGNGATGLHLQPFIHTGFTPSLVLLRRTNNSGGWFMFSDGLHPYNEHTTRLHIEVNNAVQTHVYYQLDFCSNGFKITEEGDNMNGNGDTIIYMAWAKHPFVTSTGVPATAR